MSQYTGSIEMTRTEITERLNRQGHGVLSFGGERPYGVPLSFGYDRSDGRCIFQLLSAPESTKRACIAASERVTLAAYEFSHVDSWWSVVVAGRMAAIAPESQDAVAAAEVFAEHASVVGLSIFDRALGDLEAEWFELSVDELHGYRAPGDG